ncbi:dihydrolipoamide acetyltransferase family protein [Streptomyces sp. NPDC056061]|uniref:dihydrolipoamide acetyltransferase family protein n=1 Tax=Streptomyces sp. NPDC056061 TaxID=3345700 RepID=UPI0035E106A6
MPEFTMPSLGADMDEGKLVEWLVSEGETVTRGDVVAVVETAKSTIEVECFDSGTVGSLLVAPGTTVPVGAPLAVIEPEAGPSTGRRGEHPAGPPEASGPARVGRGTVSTSTPLVRHLAEERSVDLAAVHGSGRGGRITRADVERAAAPRARRRVPASPLARRLAESLDVDLGRVRGTGRNGTVRADDVRAAAERRTPRPHSHRAGPAGTGKHGATPRSAISALMSRANREIPHYYLATTIDLATAMDWMRERNTHSSVKERLVPAALLLKAIALAARQVPQLNGHWSDDAFTQAENVRLGIAVSLRGGGLVAPALPNADDMSVAALMAALKDVVARARRGRLRASETADPTLTVTNLGDQGAETVFGVIYPPQVALVGLGRVVERPVAVDGMLAVHPTVTATLSADHRASDGATGARFLTAVDRLLQRPEEL